MTAPLAAMPLIDIRDGGPPRFARQCADDVRALRDACLSFFPRAALPLVPALDRMAERALMLSRSPYVGEIAEIAAALGFSGAWLLNASYLWGCTALACEQEREPWLIRTLDWPFKGLGRHAAAALMRGGSGDFYSVTWPGYVGALTAIAPFRFAACINQAPLWRRTRSRWLRPFDFAVNAGALLSPLDGMPPDQLLRQTFERCEDYAAARRMLESIPVARPAIFVLVGCASGERCVIERTTVGSVTREEDTSAANDWLPSRPGWEGRIGTRRFLTSSFEAAAAYSQARREALAEWRGTPDDRGFGWVQAPVLNPYTRLVVAMCPARGILRAIGYDAIDGELPQPVTQMREIEVASPQSAA